MAESAGSAAGAPYRGFRAPALLVFLILLNILNFIDRILPQAFIVDIMRDVGFTYTQFTLINGPVFGLVYAIAGLGMGVMADRFHRPRLIAAGLFIWSGLTAATGLATNFIQMTVARAFVAVGEASLSPSALSMLSNVFPPKRRGMITSLYYIGISLGAGGSYVIAGTLGAAIGWRNCFLVLGAIGVVLALIVAFLPEPRQGGGTGRADSAAAPSVRAAAGAAVKVINRSPSLRWVLIAATLLLFGQGASILDQAWLVKELGFETGDAQRRFGGLFLIGSLAGALLGGPLADLFVRRSPAGRLYYAIAIYALVVPVSIFLRVMEPSAAFYIGFLIVSAGVTLHYASLLPTVQELAPLHARATIIAVTLLVMALIGTALGNLAAGMLADLYIAQGLERPVTWAIISINLVSLLALPALYMAARNYSRDREAHGSLD